MSATSSPLSIKPEVEREYEEAVDTLRSAEPGDFVLFGDRVQPLEVTSASGDRGDRTIVLEGPQGGTYTINEDYEGVGDARVPSFTTEEQGISVNDLRFSEIESGDRLPQMLRQIRGRVGGDGDSDSDPEDMDGEDTDADDDDSVFDDFDVSAGKGKLIVSGTHADYGSFTVVFVWSAEDNGWMPMPDRSTLGADLDQSDRGVLLADIENATEDEGFDVAAITPDNFDPDESATQSEDPVPESEGTEYDADEYVSILSSDPMMDFDTFAEKAGAVGPEESTNILDRFFGDGDDEQPSWTFIDELLWKGYNIPKTVNNWHLIDYGIITDDTAYTTRKAGWYNVQTDEMVVLGAVAREEGSSEMESDVGYFVYEVDDATTISGDEREPSFQTTETQDAVERVKSNIYGGADEADIIVMHDGGTGKITILDALSSTWVARRVLSVRDADPFGIRSYIASNDAIDFIYDADRAIQQAASTTATGARSIGSAVQTTGNFIYGILSGFSPSSSPDISGVDIGRSIKAVLLDAVLGIKDRWLGVRVNPVIDFDELGVVVEYRYIGSDGDETTGRPSRRTIDPRTNAARQRDEALKSQFVSPDAGRVGENPQLSLANDYLVDSFLPDALSYTQFVYLADWANINDYVFDIPDPWDDTDQSLSIGTLGENDSGTSSSSSGFTSRFGGTAGSSGTTNVTASELVSDTDGEDFGRLSELISVTKSKGGADVDEDTLIAYAALVHTYNEFKDQYGADTDIRSLDKGELSSFLGSKNSDVYGALDLPQNEFVKITRNLSETRNKSINDLKAVEKYAFVLNTIERMQDKNLSIESAMRQEIRMGNYTNLKSPSLVKGINFDDEDIGPTDQSSDDGDDGDDGDDDPFEDNIPDDADVPSVDPPEFSDLSERDWEKVQDILFRIETFDNEDIAGLPSDQRKLLAEAHGEKINVQGDDSLLSLPQEKTLANTTQNITAESFGRARRSSNTFSEEEITPSTEDIQSFTDAARMDAGDKMVDSPYR